jgi:hypothetical protein
MLFIQPHSLLTLPALDKGEDRRAARTLSTTVYPRLAGSLFVVLSLLRRHA